MMNGRQLSEMRQKKQKPNNMTHGGFVENKRRTDGRRPRYPYIPRSPVITKVGNRVSFSLRTKVVNNHNSSTRTGSS